MRSTPLHVPRTEGLKTVAPTSLSETVSSIYAVCSAQVELVTRVELSIFYFQIFVIIIHNALCLAVKNNRSEVPSAAQVQLPGFSVDRIVGGFFPPLSVESPETNAQSILMSRSRETSAYSLL